MKQTLQLIGLVALLGAGCSRPTPPSEPTAATITEDELTPVWDSALAALRRYDFRPDRQDRAAGVITTFPVTSMQWHEPWRQDVADGWHLAHASLHTVRRQVTVRFVHNGDWRVEVEVNMFLLSTPESQVTTASSAIRSFTGDLPTVTGERPDDARANRDWVPLGRDGAMENRLLSAIVG